MARLFPGRAQTAPPPLWGASCPGWGGTATRGCRGPGPALRRLEVSTRTIKYKQTDEENTDSGCQRDGRIHPGTPCTPGQGSGRGRRQRPSVLQEPQGFEAWGEEDGALPGEGAASAGRRDRGRKVLTDPLTHGTLPDELTKSLCCAGKKSEAGRSVQDARPSPCAGTPGLAPRRDHGAGSQPSACCGVWWGRGFLRQSVLPLPQSKMPGVLGLCSDGRFLQTSLPPAS